jgi:hypothetical protein
MLFIVLGILMLASFSSPSPPFSSPYYHHQNINITNIKISPPPPFSSPYYHHQNINITNIKISPPPFSSPSKHHH